MCVRVERGGGFDGERNRVCLLTKANLCFIHSGASHVFYFSRAMFFWLAHADQDLMVKWC